MKKFLKINKKLILAVFLIYLITAALLNYYNKSLTDKLSDRVWIHRVNSTEKLKEVSQKSFKGIEVDVVFMDNTNSFDVNHPPAKSINLSLFDYLNSIEIKESESFWIDFKNLSQLNTENSVSKLDSICNTLQLKKGQFIIESDEPQLLSTFKESGYKTSYYLPTSLCNSPSNLLENELNIVKNNIRLHSSDYISLDKCNYLLMKENFPEKQKLLWSFPYQSRWTLNPRSLARMPEQISLKRELLSDKTVEAILFGYVALEGNR